MIRITNNSILTIQEAFENFNINNLVLKFSEDSTINKYDIKYSYSIDKQNFSEPKIKSEFVLPNDLLVPVFISIEFKKIPVDIYNQINTLRPEKNVDSTLFFLDLQSLKYTFDIDNIKNFDLNELNEVRFQTFYDLINQYPKWNFYDNQQITIKRWLAQCNAIAEMYGHSCIYFKTEPIESEVVHTFANQSIRNVVNIKKIKVLSPNNELPQDRTVYSEWDAPLQDEFVLHVVDDIFKTAFGNTIPSEKDYLFLPIINKLFRVSGVQPKNGFMGKIGWWEVYLSKYEQDETVTIAGTLKEIYSNIPEFEGGMDEMENLEADEELGKQLLEEFEFLNKDTVETAEKIQQKTIDEKKQATQNFTNKSVDSTFNISLKETEKIREFYDNRLKIVSVNPDSQAFPITMYNNQTVPKRTIALQYNLKDFSAKNKANLTVSKNFEFSFNFILLNNFVGEIFDLLTETNISIFTIQNNRNKIELVDSLQQKTYLVDFKFELHEFYNILVVNDISNNQIICKIFTNQNKEKVKVFENIYIKEVQQNPNLYQLTNINLYGGNFLSSEIKVNIDLKNIFTDFVNPLLQMKQF